MKKGLLFALLVMLCTVIKAQEPTVETVGNLKYYCDPATMEATVVGPIESWDNDEFNQSFTKIDIQTTVTSGGNMYILEILKSISRRLAMRLFPMRGR